MGKQEIRTAMILAAGFGTRMKNIMNNTPKPLLPLGSTNLLHLNLIKMYNAGIKRVVINLHHYADKIKNYLYYNPIPHLEILFSEEKTILGTGGGIANAEKYFENENILVTNADIISNLNYQDFFDRFYSLDPLASIAVLPSKNYLEYGLITYDKNKLTSFKLRNEIPEPEEKTAIFMGYHILTPQARKYLKPIFSSIITSCYYQVLKANQYINVYIHNGLWIDVGTREKYLDILDLIEKGKIHLDSFK
jgi:NDP-sugar pyrophosphorylase family protein